MFDYVIDTNVVMCMLISGKAHYRTILSYANFYLPEFSLSELDEYYGLKRKGYKNVIVFKDFLNQL